MKVKVKRTKFKTSNTIPLFISSLFFIFGIIAAVGLFRFPSYTQNADALISTPILLATLTAIFVIAFVMYGKGINITLVLCAFMTIAGFVYTQITLEKNYPDDMLIAHTNIKGTIVSLDGVGENSLTLILDDVEISGEAQSQKIDSRVSLIIFGQSGSYLESEYNLQNSEVNINASLEYPSIAQEYGFYDERMNMLSSNTAYKAAVHYGQVKIVKENPPPYLYSAVWNIRRTLFDRLERYVGEDEADLVKALLTGQKDDLSYDIKEAFAKLGISHLLATSGLHIGILLLAVEYVSKKAKIQIIPKMIISVGLILIFMILSGFRISIIRASLMWAMVMGARMSGGKYNGINSLGAAMLLIMLVNPMCVYDVSFILSCVSVLAIALFAKPMAGLAKDMKNNKLITIAATTMAVIIFAWPITSYYFNSVSMLSPIYNILFIPMMSVLLLLSFVFSIFSGVTFIAPILAVAVRLISFAAIQLAEGLQAYSLSWLIISPPVISIVIWLSGMMVLSDKVLSVKAKPRYIIGCLMLVVSVLTVALTQLNMNRQEVMKVNSDYSVSIVCIQEKNKKALVMNEYSYVAKTILQKSATRKLDTLIFSGNKVEDLAEILEELGDIDVGAIYAHNDIAEQMPEYNILTLGEVDFEGYHISLIPFKAKSKTAIIHYAAMITHDGTTTMYFDPLSLREGAFEEIRIDNVVASRWSKSRAENLEYLDFTSLNFQDNQYLYDNIITSLEQKGSKIYNINDAGSIDLLKRNNAYELQRVFQYY